MQQPMSNPEEISDPTTAMNMTLVLMAKAFKLNYSTPTNNNQRTLSNPQQADYIARYEYGARKTDRAGWRQCVECQESANQNVNQTWNGNVVASQAGVNGNGNNDGSAKVYHSENWYDNDIFNLFTQEEQYIELFEPNIEPHQAQQNDNNVISRVPIVEKSGGTVEQQPATIEETQFHKIIEDEIAPIVNQVDNRVQNFENPFVKEAAKFVRDFKSLAKEADDSINKITVLETENERLLRAIVSQDIMSIVQNKCIIDTSNLQTELDRMKEKFETCIIKKEKEYAILWNNWYKKCEECKYDKISYDKAYNDMQNQIEWLQAQLGDLKGKSMDTQCSSNTLDPLF
ncbi:hypothetical protein Tco_0424763 [Tanacetum coccineum]